MKTFSLTENQFSRKTYLNTIGPWPNDPERRGVSPLIGVRHRVLPLLLLQGGGSTAAATAAATLRAQISSWEKDINIPWEKGT